MRIFPVLYMPPLPSCSLLLSSQLLSILEKVRSNLIKCPMKGVSLKRVQAVEFEYERLYSKELLGPGNRAL